MAAATATGCSQAAARRSSFSSGVPAAHPSRPFSLGRTNRNVTYTLGKTWYHGAVLTKRTRVGTGSFARYCKVAVLLACGCTEPFHTQTPGTGGVKGAGGAPAIGGRLGAGGEPGTGGVSATTKTIGAGGMPATGGVLGMGGSGGTSGTVSGRGGAVGTGGGLVGGNAAGGASSSAGGADGGTSGTEACATPSSDYCVEACLADHALWGNATCSNGAWGCRSGYVLASSCPAQGCGVTPDACCDSTTGAVTQNPCKTDGYREACPSKNTATYLDEAYCVPDSLVPTFLNNCFALDRRPCNTADPATGCSDVESGLGVVTCGCGGAVADGSIGTWYCSAFMGS